jgi:hypothetical protein
MSKIVVDKKFVREMKSLTVEEAIEIFGKGVFSDKIQLRYFMEKALYIIGDMGACWVLATNEIPKDLKEIIGHYVAYYYCFHGDFPKAAAYVARNGYDEEKMVFIRACNYEMWLDVSLDASEEVMRALVESIQKRLEGLRNNYNYEGEIKAEIDEMRLLARAISLRDDVSSEIREMAKYAAL